MPSRARIATASRFAPSGVQAVEPGREQQVLHRAELLEEGGVDADPVDQPLDRHLVALDVVAEDLDPALVEGQQARDEPDERRLARAVGAEDPVDVAALEAERDVARSPSPACCLRPTTKRFVTPSTRSAGTAGSCDRDRPTASTRRAVIRLSDEGCGHLGLELLARCGVPGATSGRSGKCEKPRVPLDVL